MITTFDSWLTPMLAKPDIVHLYIEKSAGHCTLLLSIANLSCALLGESKFPVAVARFFTELNLSFHFTSDACPDTETMVSNIVLVFFSSWMKYTSVSCEGLEIEHKMTKSFSGTFTVGGWACIWIFCEDAKKRKSWINYYKW